MERRKNYFIVVKIMIFVICMAMAQTHVLAAQKLKVTGSRTVVIGETIKLKTNISSRFRSSDSRIASVSAKGIVKGKKPGKVTITVTARRNKNLKKKVKITVKNKLIVKAPEGGKAVLRVGEKTVIRTNQKCSYTAEDPAIAAVYSDGTIAAKTVGTTVIHIRAKSSQKLKADVKVQVIDAGQECSESSETPAVATEAGRPESGEASTVATEAGRPESSEASTVATEAGRPESSEAFTVATEERRTESSETPTVATEERRPESSEAFTVATEEYRPESSEASTVATEESSEAPVVTTEVNSEVSTERTGWSSTEAGSSEEIPVEGITEQETPAESTTTQKAGDIETGQGYSERPEKLYLGLSKVIPDTTFGYGIGNPTVDISDKGKYIWNVVSYKDDGDQLFWDQINGNLYCLKAGAGFRSAGEQADQIRKEYTLLCSINEKEKMQNCGYTYVEELADSVYYDHVRWILEHMDVKGSSTGSDYKKMLSRLGISQYRVKEWLDEGQDEVFRAPVKTLEETGGRYLYFDGAEFDYSEMISIGTVASGGYSGILGHGALAAVQQAAIWYYTNQDDANYTAAYREKQNWLYRTEDGGKSYASFGDTEGEQAGILYRYFIDGAERDAKSSDANRKVPPVTLKSDHVRRENGDRGTVIGPINLSLENDLEYEMDLQLMQSEQEITEYDILDADGNSISKADIQKYTGDFFVSIPERNADGLTVQFHINYYERDAYIYVEEDKDGQPVVLPERIKQSYQIEVQL